MAEYAIGFWEQGEEHFDETGPWVAIEGAHEGDLIAWARCDHEDQTNAHLIAAAPDLLEALEEAVECGMVPKSSTKDGGASRKIRHVQVADQIRDAIAKARGENHDE